MSEPKKVNLRESSVHLQPSQPLFHVSHEGERNICVHPEFEFGGKKIHFCGSSTGTSQKRTTYELLHDIFGFEEDVCRTLSTKTANICEKKTPKNSSEQRRAGVEKRCVHMDD